MGDPKLVQQLSDHFEAHHYSPGDVAALREDTDRQSKFSADLSASQEDLRVAIAEIERRWRSDSAASEIATACDLLREPRWPAWLAILWLHHRGDQSAVEDEIRASIEGGCGFSRRQLSDRGGLVIHPDKQELASRHLADFARSGAVKSFGLPVHCGSARGSQRQEIPPQDWDDRGLYFNERTDAFEIRELGVWERIEDPWTEVTFDSEDVRCAVSVPLEEAAEQKRLNEFGNASRWFREAGHREAEKVLRLQGIRFSDDAAAGWASSHWARYMGLEIRPESLLRAWRRTPKRDLSGPKQS